MVELLFGFNDSFKSYTVEHLLPLCFFMLSGFLWIRVSKSWSEERCRKSAFRFSIFLMSLVLMYMMIKIMRSEFNPSTDLPFHLCNLLTFILPIALIKNKKWLNGVLYFWILVGTFQALVTPDLKEGFPHFIYFRFWTVHAGLVMIVIFSLLRLNWKVEFRHVFYAVLSANVFLLFSFIVNYFTEGNYFYSMHKPSSASLLDYLGDWPYYLINGQLVMLLLFLIYYLPVYLIQRMKKQ